MMAALHENLGAPEREGFRDLIVHLGERDHIGVGVLFDAVEGAEFAVNVADVRVIDIAIDIEGDDVVAAPGVGGGFGELAAAVGERAEFLQRQIIEPAGLGLVNALTSPNLLL